jgi:uncharacterized coiled-coil protein SlyX
VAQLREDEKALFKSTSQVDRMYNVLQQYEVTVPSEHLVLHEDLHDRQAEYRREIEAAQSFKENKLSEMVTGVETNIVKLQDQMASVVAKLEEPTFVEVDLINDPNKVLEDLNVLGQRLESADQLAKTYSGYQRLFGVPVFDQTELEAGNEKFETIRKMWELVKLWGEKHALWLESNFTG